MPGRSREDLRAIAFVVLVHVLIGAFLLARPDRFCFGDCVSEMLPRLLSVARSVQSGVLPLWDTSTFAGGRPLWVSGGGIYYPPLFPLYFLANPGDPAHAATLLMLVPFLLHLTWAALGAFLFARLALRLSAAGAVVTAVTYAFSPPMWVMDFVMQTQVYSYLPWIVLMAWRVVQGGSRRAWAGGALLVGAMSFAGNPDLVNRVLFLVGLQVAACWFFWSWRRWSVAGAARLLWATAMVVVGLGIFGFGWAGLREGIAWATDPLPLSCPQIAALTWESSAPFRALLTAFYPASFPQLLTLANLGAGSVILSAASAAVFRGARQWPTLRPHIAAAAGVTVFSALVALGHHTPIFEGLCRALPLFFSFPHPVYYTLGVSWGIAILAGTGITVLAAAPPGRAALFLYCWPIPAAVAMSAAQVQIPSLEWSERLLSAPAYALALGALLAALVLLAARSRPAVLCAGALIEAAISPFHLASVLPTGSSPHALDYRTWTISQNPAVQLRPFLQRLATEDAVRYVGVRSFFDNQSWLVGGRALLGHSSKPVAPRLRETFAAFTFNAPYELWLYSLPRLLANMNVAYLIVDRVPLYDFLHPPEPLRTGLAEFYAAVSQLPLAEQTSHYDIRVLPDPMPYAYTQERVFAVSEYEQRQHLLHSDLRLGAYVDASVLAGRVGSPPPPEGREEDFEELQRANRIVAIDRSDPNRKRVRIDVRRPALLVIAEVWHPGWRARVDGEDRPVWQVNYLQQGVWVDAGTRMVELRFEPPSLGYGILCSVLSLVSVAFVAAVEGRRGRSRLAGAVGPDGSTSASKRAGGWFTPTASGWKARMRK